MGILQRIEEIRAVEHQKLRLALSRADTKLRQLEEEERNPVPVKRATDMFGDPIPTSDAPKYRVVVVTPLLRFWRLFEELVLTRLDRWEEDLWPLVRRWNQGELVGIEVQRLAGELQAARDRVEVYLREVRREALFVEDVSQLMTAVYAAVSLCDRAEQAEVIPALLSGSRETADRTERTTTGDDVARRLRANILSDEGEVYQDEEEERPTTPWGRLWSRLSGQ